MHENGYPYPMQPMMPGYPYMPMPPQYQPMPLISLDEAIQGYVRFKQSKGKDHKTIADIDLSLRSLSFVRPDIQYVHQITKRLILEYEALIAEVPANYRKVKKLRNLPFGQLRNVAWDMPKLSPASIDKYTLTLRAFIGWCQDTDRMPPWKMPRFEGLDKRNSKDKRHPFKSEELAKLYGSPMFTGHSADLSTQLRRHREGTLLVKDHFYWVPILGVYTGMRLREIIQLWIADVRQEDGVH